MRKQHEDKMYKLHTTHTHTTKSNKNSNGQSAVCNLNCNCILYTYYYVCVCMAGVCQACGSESLSWEVGHLGDRGITRGKERGIGRANEGKTERVGGSEWSG